VVDAILKENGVTHGADAQQIPLHKLHEVFGADAVLYITITEYGTVYQIVSSVTTVSVNAELRDIQTGTILWKGTQTIAHNPNSGGNNGLAELLIKALVNQIVSSTRDEAHYVSYTVSSFLFTPEITENTRLLYGPRSPKYALTATEPKPVANDSSNEKTANTVTTSSATPTIK
jgi:hypothetical protein